MAYRREDFPTGGELPWLDRPDAADQLERARDAGTITAEEHAELTRWIRDGFLVYRGLFEAELAAEINADIEQIVEANRGRPVGEIKKHFENVFKTSDATRRAMVLPQLLERLDRILGVRAIPHQSLNLPISSQQDAHSDEVLMTSHPPGFLIAAWFALEDIDEQCGPLFYYPGSHRWDYIGAREIGIPLGASNPEADQCFDASYYDLVRAAVAAHDVEPQVFLPKCGDVLVWHSNLLHGALKCTRGDATRRSLIAHYYGDGAIHYSDLYQRLCADPGLR